MLDSSRKTSWARSSIKGICEICPEKSECVAELMKFMLARYYFQNKLHTLTIMAQSM